MLWIVRPKGSKAIGESDVFEAAKGAGLVDTKVVAFSKTHTAHKCVIPVELRGQTVRQRPPILTIPPSAPRPSAEEGAARRKASPAPAKAGAGGEEGPRGSRRDRKPKKHK